MDTERLASRGMADEDFCPGLPFVGAVGGLAGLISGGGTGGTTAGSNASGQGWRERKKEATMHRGRGIACALGAAVLFGASTPLAKGLLGDISPWMLAGVLYLASGIGLAVLAGVRRLGGGERAEAALTLADLPWLLAVILTGGIAGPVLLMLGLGATPAATASLLLNLEGVFTLGLAWMVFRENVDRRILLGALAILAGAALLTGSGGEGAAGEGVFGETGGASGWGMLAIVAACLAWGIDNNLTRKLSTADPLQIALLKGGVAGTVNVALALSAGGAIPPVPALLAAAVVGFFGYGVSLVLFVLALRHLGSARTGAYFSLAPFAGSGIAILGLGEPVTLSFLLAAVLMAIGLFLHLVERHAHQHEHLPMAHNHRHRHDSHHQHDHPAGMLLVEPHSHPHSHARLQHSHVHDPDIHHRHRH